MNMVSSPTDGKAAPAVLWVHATALVSALMVCLLLPLSFELTSFKTLIVGDATLGGIDVSKRVGTAYRLILGGAAGAVLVYALLRGLEARRWLRLRRHDELLLLSVALLCLSFFRVMGTQCLTVLNLLLGIWGLRAAVLAAANRLPVLRILRPQGVFALSAAYAFLGFFAVVFVFGSNDWMRENPVRIVLALLLAFSALYVGLRQALGWEARRTSRAMVPLAAVPVLAFVSIEAFFYAREARGAHLPFRSIWAGGLALVAAAYALLLYRRRVPPLRKLVAAVVAPAVVVGFVLLFAYTPVLTYDPGLFEPANLAVPLQHVFRFGKLPLLDFMSSHLVSEQWFGYLYTLLFGAGNKMEFLVWWFLNWAVLWLILYGLFLRLFRRPLLAAFFLVLFPMVNDVFFLPVAPAVLLFFFTRKLIERPSPKLFFGLFAMLLGIILWRMDSGSAAVFAAVFYLPMVWWATRTRFPAAAFVKGGLLTAAVVGAGVAAGALLRSPAIVVADIRMTLAYFSANQGHGYRAILSGFTHQFYLMHVLAPALAVVACLYILAQLRRGASPGRVSNRQLVLLGALLLYLIYFANLQRGLVRHGYAEGSDLFLLGTFFAATGLLCAYLAGSRRPVTQVAVAYGGAVASALFLLFAPYNPGAIAAETALTESATRNLDGLLYSDAYEGRTKKEVAATLRAAYVPLKTFLDAHLSDRQTFLDFSNTPMLYYYCQRESPGYFCQNLQNAVGDYLQLALLRDAPPEKAPVVLFASYPRDGLDALDGVPNTLRDYLVAESIFAQYRPYGVVGDKSIWVAKDFPALPPAPPDTLLEAPYVANHELLPYYLGAFYGRPGQAGSLHPVRSWSAPAASTDSVLGFVLDSSVLALRHCYLGLDFKQASPPPEQRQVHAYFLGPSGDTVSAIQFDRRDGTTTPYLLRLSNHYFWHRFPTLRLRISPAAEVSRVSILKDGRF